MEDLFDRVLDRTRSRLDIPAIRTIFGLKTRPHRNRKDGPPAQEIVIEKPRYGLSWFRISFGRLQLKAYTKGEHVLRFEATVHNAKELRCRRSLDNFDEIITRLAGMADRFATALDCADIGFLPDGVLDELPLPAQAGATPDRRDRPEQAADPGRPVRRARPGPGPWRVHRRRARRQGPPDHRPGRLHHPAGRLRPAQAPRQAAHRQTRPDPPLPRPATTPPAPSAALLTLRDHVIAPILAGVRSPRMGRKPKIWTAVDRDYETLRIGMQTLFRHVGIDTRHGSRIDNILSIGECKLLGRCGGPSPHVSQNWSASGADQDIGGQHALRCITALSCLAPVAGMAKWLTSQCGALILDTSCGQRRRPGQGCPESSPAWATPSADTLTSA